MFYNVVNAVSKENNCIEAVSDSRKNGKAAGYWPGVQRETNSHQISQLWLTHLCRVWMK